MLKWSKGLGQSGSRDMAAQNVREVPDLEGYADETDGCAIDVTKHYKRPIPHAMGGRSHDSGHHPAPPSKLSLITDGCLGVSSLLSGRVYIVNVVALVSLAP